MKYKYPEITDLQDIIEEIQNFKLDDLTPVEQIKTIYLLRVLYEYPKLVELINFEYALEVAYG